jgi:hypothetical protein
MGLMYRSLSDCKPALDEAVKHLRVTGVCFQHANYLITMSILALACPIYGRTPLPVDQTRIGTGLEKQADQVGIGTPGHHHQYGLAVAELGIHVQPSREHQRKEFLQMLKTTAYNRTEHVGPSLIGDHQLGPMFNKQSYRLAASNPGGIRNEGITSIHPSIQDYIGSRS